MKIKLQITLILFLMFYITKSQIVNNTTYKTSNLVVITIKKNSMNFKVTTQSPYNNVFYMNSNFFKNSKTPIGEVVIKGKVINKKENYGGYFYTINGIPNISIGSRPNRVDYSSQTKYIGIKNGKINNNIVDKPLNSKKDYRTLIGKNSNGDLVIIHSSRTGLISMRNICEFGLSLGIKVGLIFDGGSSVDIGIQDHSFKSIPFGKNLVGIDQPPVFIVANFK